MADAAQRTIQLAIVWFLKKRRAKRARMIEEKRSSFLYIHNRQRRHYFGQLLLVCINQPRLRTIWMNPGEATWFEMVTTDLLRPTLPPQTRFFHGFFLTQRRPIFQTTPFCLLKIMCACATEFGYAGPFFAGRDYLARWSRPA